MFVFVNLIAKYDNCLVGRLSLLGAIVLRRFREMDEPTRDLFPYLIFPLLKKNLPPVILVYKKPFELEEASEGRSLDVIKFVLADNQGLQGSFEATETLVAQHFHVILL